ncbi:MULTISPECIES: alpha-ketoacid dehydrogenase subunit beta [Meiothermus]|uniref:2-oxoisovalerate dehydrogenase subunit beta n=2 Tax=Meiothermus hypogaeus TaxID=884155 RepID=A0A511QY83_9DEIN|nr:MULTISPECIES: alpha-ketoacid dehydrogenase subunit beta [Meiothermus]RIH77401.1 2-oxoisovalerate dehydrogenase subunit beta [Meiothermus hypogaeus]GEM82343.1 2-oxoisovalerate dehydrogenase subunit beta [Meiothermus hypogaeus NBRC 106114]GIW33022.1 MAG: 2-oxoisovalerate dehydrogenase subunit beta [Meiothermus sp.]GIW37227.1 MAG: 2-oxoisovalerate dehydrogenase subunit beta [Meiothermus sp.]
MPTMTLIQALNTALDEELRRDERVMILGEDVGKRGGVFLATEGLQEKYGPDRVMDTPLSEAAIIGAAVGLAAHGMRPVAEIQFADYVFPGIDQLFSQAAKLRYRSGGQFTAPMVVRMPTGGGVKGGHHHSQSPEAHFAHTAGLKVVVVATPKDAKGLLKAAIRDDDPVVFMEPKRLYRAVKEEVPADDFLLPIGKAAIRREGRDITLVSYGGPMVETQKAAQEMAAAGIDPEVIDLRTLVPWDKETVLNSVAKTGRLLMISEAPRTASVASEVAATVSEELFDQLLAPPLRVSGFDTPYPLAQDKLYMPTVTRILNAAKRLLDY